ncbi:MAG: DUF1003 domain-containing protein [Thermomicrobiales bacterium]
MPIPAGPHDPDQSSGHRGWSPQGTDAGEQTALRKLLGPHPHHLRNLNDIQAEHLTAGERIADDVARMMGAWRFIIIQTVILVSWIALNVIGWIQHWDPYPFILLNLALSFQAAYSAPIIMMSQNRQATKDRLAAEHDYLINVHAEEEVAAIRARLDNLGGEQWDALVELQHQQLILLTRIEQLTAEVHRLTTATNDPSTSPPSA